MSDFSIKNEIQQMADIMVETAYRNIFSECLASITELSQMGMNATWADDIYKCFIVTPNVTDSSVNISIDLDVGNEFVLMTKAREKNLIEINGQDTTEDLDKSGEDWIQNDPLNIEGNLRMIMTNVEIRSRGVAKQVYEDYKSTITDKFKEYIITKAKEAIGE